MAQPRPYLLELAQQIWYPLEAKPKVHALYFQLKTQALKENWPAAIACAQSLEVADRHSNAFWYWQIARLELFLFAGEPQKTHRELDRILASSPKPTTYSSVRRCASTLKARALLEQGDCQGALAWQKRAHDAYWSRCGNGYEQERSEYTPLRTVWQAATLPYAQAVVALEAIRAGKFEPYVTRLEPRDTSAKRQRRHAYEEASLVLGELHQRAGDQGRARQALLEAAKSEDDTLALLARTHLRKLPQTTPRLL